MNPERHLIDDRATAPAAGWRCFTDQVMGGLSTATVSDETCAGRPALVLRGRLRTENSGGFVQMALDVLPPPGDWLGLSIDLAGTSPVVGVHLRTSGLAAPWQAWRARVEGVADWRAFTLPWNRFAPYRFDGTLDPRTIRRIGIVVLAEGRPGDAEVALGSLAWVR